MQKIFVYFVHFLYFVMWADTISAFTLVNSLQQRMPSCFSFWFNNMGPNFAWDIFEGTQWPEKVYISVNQKWVIKSEDNFFLRIF